MVDSNSPGNTREEIVGIWLVVVASLVSFVSVIALLAHIAINKVIRRLPLERLTTATPYYFINLLFLDVLMAIGGVLNAHWANEKGPTPGEFCTAQAVIQQIGNVGVAWTTALIALHCAIRYHMGIPDEHPHRTGIAMTVVIWVALGLLVTIPLARKPDDYYGVSGKWCWIKTGRTTDMIVAEYMWLWICALLTILIYFFIWLDAGKMIKWSFGHDGIWVAVFKPGSRDKSRTGFGFGFFRIQGQLPLELSNELSNLGTLGPRDSHQLVIPVHNSLEVDRSITELTTRKAKRLLWYPLVYTIVILPQSIIRLLEFTEKVSPENMPIWATTIGGSLIWLSGFFNVVLYFATGRHFGFPEPRITPNL
ncbi:hypothetical protein B0J17DRAFT_681269 [Rhizoctonia solani]|nr:hypothetical protein B0J17DRAFT_681269 [Rhizoctonia solani]